jgi:nitrile hydratase
MNGVYDMGGLDGLGKLSYEAGQPYSAFVHPAEARLRAIKHELEKKKRWSPHAFRHYQQRLPAAEYLNMRYYEHWLVAIVDLLADTKLATRDELDEIVTSGGPGRRRRKGHARVDDDAPRGRGDRDDKDDDADDDGAIPPAQFAVGDRVRSRSSDASTFTRQPRYTRGHVGVVERVHPAIGVPTVRLRGKDREFRHVYGVRFSARDLWGEDANARDSVRVDLWENYLERA